MSHRREHDLGEQRWLTVQLPEDYAAGSRDYPLLLCLDAQWTFGTVCDSALILGLGRLLPRVIVAGLGWRHAAIRDIVVARSLAYTPSVADFPPEVTAPSERALVAGGGPAYLDWMATDVLDLLTREYRIAPSARTLVGHSLSGLFGLFCAARRPALFEHYLLASPSVWWQDRIILSMLDATDGLCGRLYMTMGEGERIIAGCDMIATARGACDLLRVRHPALDTRFDLLPGEIHQSTIAGSVTHGLRWLFGAV